MSEPQAGGYDLRRVRGGMLMQDWDTGSIDVRNCKVVTDRKPTEEEYRALDFAWRVCRHVKSNTIVFASPDQVLGAGAGQMSRIDSTKIAVLRAATHGLSLQARPWHRMPSIRFAMVLTKRPMPAPNQ